MELHLDRFDRAWAMKPFWEGNTVYQESVVFVPDENGVMEAPLFYMPEHILSVRDSSLRIEYREGEDFVITGNKICRTKNSRMAHFTYDEFYCPGQTGENIMDYDFGGHLRVDGGWFFHPKNIHVTYTHCDQWEFEKPKYKGDRLPRLMEKLRAHSVLTAVFFGDSVMSGDECSGYLDAEPHQPEWTVNFCEQICRKYGCFIHRIDTAVGGTDLTWGKENCIARVAAMKPDIALIGFGNNDRCSVEDYLAGMREIVETVRRESPDTDFIIVDPMRPHRYIARTTDGYRWDALQGEYAKAHLCLEKEYEGLAVLEIMQLHLNMQKHKRFWDINNNNINHPNDFFYRVIAQACTALVVPPEQL
ncbi:MAG: SGNH/GDSL hydrolase family protein [Clostridia bacterium]|nr:SGNH/GDSL hydrolase family protein [Clostridia bacterium]